MVHIKEIGKSHTMNFLKKDILKRVHIKKEMIFPEYLRNFHNNLRTQKDDLAVLKKTVR